jgi:transcriptional regulator with XRE-family HTH domain
MSHLNYPAIRAALRKHRLDRRLSYNKLARELGMAQQTVENFIEGTTERPHETTVYAVEKYLLAQGVEVAA